MRSLLSLVEITMMLDNNSFGGTRGTRDYESAAKAAL